jgi:hypothetical protein
MPGAEAPEFALLSPASKRLVRKLGELRDQEIKAETGEAGRGWCALEDEGWVKIRRGHYGGYIVNFTLSGWECWCRQCDAEEGRPLQPLEFT